jgi:hypothetical protein
MLQIGSEAWVAMLRIGLRGGRVVVGSGRTARAS